MERRMDSLSLGWWVDYDSLYLTRGKHEPVEADLSLNDAITANAANWAHHSTFRCAYLEIFICCYTAYASNIKATN